MGTIKVITVSIITVVIIYIIVFFRMRFCICIPKPELQPLSFNMTIGQILQASNNYEKLNNDLTPVKKNLLTSITQIKSNIQTKITAINTRLVALGQPIISNSNNVSNDSELNLIYETLKLIKSFISDSYDASLPSSTYVRGQIFYDTLDSIITDYLNTTTLSSTEFSASYNQTNPKIVEIRNVDLMNIHNSNSYDIETFKLKLVLG